MKRMKAMNIRVTGHVQGVFFRDRTKAKAEEFHLNGWVKNTEDGAVEIHAEGEEQDLNEFVQWCGEGPPRATVDRVETKEVEAKGYDSFDIYW